MALTTTYTTGAVTATQGTFTVNAYTAPSVGPIGPVKIGRWATGEYCLITDDSNSPTLAIVRGWNGSRAVAHTAYEGFQYGLASDAAWPAAPAPNVQATVAPVTITNAQEVTITGTTGTDAAVVTAPWPAILNCSGASGAGVNLPYPVVGAQYVLKNNSSGTMKIYSVGAQLNGTTGTTAMTLTTTGSTGDLFWCATAGTWLVAPLGV